MKKLLGTLILLVLLGLTACGGAPANSPSQSSVSTVVAETLQSMTSAAPTNPPQTAPAATATAEATATSAPQGIPVSYQNVSFEIPQGLATGALSGTVNDPELPVIYPDPSFPKHIKFTLQGYTASSDIQPEVAVFKISDLTQYNDASFQGILSALQNLKYTAGQPLPQGLFGKEFNADIQTVNFKNGHGIRYLTQVMQGFAPINNHDLFYVFMGVTNDNAYFIEAILPVHASFLANTSNSSETLPQDGIQFPGFTNPNASQTDIQSYFSAVSNKLNTASPDAFSPSLAAFDSLVQSVSISQ